MKILICQTIIILAVLCTGCSSSNGSDVEELQNPKMDLYDQFGYTPEGEITYQFYHEYGFTDKVWHLITIVKPNSDSKLDKPLPLDSADLQRLEKIYSQKFMDGKPIFLTGDYKVNADVSLLVQEYHHKDSHLDINHVHGSYSIQKNGGVEILRIYDADKKLEYVELKK